MSYPNVIDYSAYRRDAAALRKNAQLAFIRNAWLWLADQVRSLASPGTAAESMRRLGA